MADDPREMCSLAEAKTAIYRAEGYSHMVGFEAFGCSGDERPEVRALGTVTFPKAGGVVVKPYDDADQWPDGEVTGGVAGIRVHSYGDHPQGSYIHVCGPDEKAVEAAWHRTNKAMAALLGAVWESGEG